MVVRMVMVVVARVMVIFMLIMVGRMLVIVVAKVMEGMLVKVTNTN